MDLVVSFINAEIRDLQDLNVSIKSIDPKFSDVSVAQNGDTYYVNRSFTSDLEGVLYSHSKDLAILLSEHLISGRVYLDTSDVNKEAYNIYPSKVEVIKYIPKIISTIYIPDSHNVSNNCSI